jgi:hypothetical protein
MKKPKTMPKKISRKASESRKKVTRKSAKSPRKRGRPRKTLKQLAVTGGYDRNPGRLLKRLGVRGRLKSPAENAARRAEIAAWDEYELRFGKLGQVAQRFDDRNNKSRRGRWQAPRR